MAPGKCKITLNIFCFRFPLLVSKYFLYGFKKLKWCCWQMLKRWKRSQFSDSPVGLYPKYVRHQILPELPLRRVPSSLLYNTSCVQTVLYTTSIISLLYYVFHIKKINQSSKCCLCERGGVMCNSVCVSRCIRWFDGQSDIRANFIYIIESILNFNIQGWVAFQTTCLCCPVVSPRENLILKSSKIFLRKFSLEFKC